MAAPGDRAGERGGALGARFLLKPPDPLPEAGARHTRPERSGEPAARHDAYRLPEGGVVLVPNPMLPLALLSGFGLLAVGLFVALTDPTGSSSDLVGCAGIIALWVLFLTFVMFFASRSLVAGPGWLATKRGLR